MDIEPKRLAERLVDLQDRLRRWEVTATTLMRSADRSQLLTTERVEDRQRVTNHRRALLDEDVRLVATTDENIVRHQQSVAERDRDLQALATRLDAARGHTERTLDRCASFLTLKQRALEAARIELERARARLREWEERRRQCADNLARAEQHVAAAAAQLQQARAALASCRSQPPTVDANGNQHPPDCGGLEVAVAIAEQDLQQALAIAAQWRQQLEEAVVRCREALETVNAWHAEVERLAWQVELGEQAMEAAEEAQRHLHDAEDEMTVAAAHRGDAHDAVAIARDLGAQAQVALTQERDATDELVATTEQAHAATVEAHSEFARGRDAHHEAIEHGRGAIGDLDERIDALRHYDRPDL